MKRATPIRTGNTVTGYKIVSAATQIIETTWQFFRSNDSEVALINAHIMAVIFSPIIIEIKDFG